MKGKGYTAVELMVVVGMIAILFTIAMPFFLQWRHQLNASQGARSAYDALRQARSRALATHYQHMVSFDPSEGRFRVLRGNRSYNTPAGEWGTVVQGWASLASGVTMTTGADNSGNTVNVQFNADGTACLETPAGTRVPPPGSVTITMRGGSSPSLCSVVVAPCGRVSLK